MNAWAQWRARPLAAPYAPLEALLASLPASDWPTPADWSALAVRAGIRNARGLPLRFVPASQSRLSALDFERRMFELGEVETRAESWHDAFHACAWLTFPRTKARINALHIETGASESANARSPLRDLLTLFDESGLAVACADPALAELLAGFRWHELFWQRRAEVLRAMDFVIAGHALHEHCHALYDGVTAKAIVVPVHPGYFALTPSERLALLDAALAARFADPAAFTGPRDLQPLPIKGIPGWAPENADPAYYRDERQFRPGRKSRNP